MNHIVLSFLGILGSIYASSQLVRGWKNDSIDGHMMAVQRDQSPVFYWCYMTLWGAFAVLSLAAAVRLTLF